MPLLLSSINCNICCNWLALGWWHPILYMKLHIFQYYNITQVEDAFFPWFAAGVSFWFSPVWFWFSSLFFSSGTCAWFCVCFSLWGSCSSLLSLQLCEFFWFEDFRLKRENWNKNIINLYKWVELKTFIYIKNLPVQLYTHFKIVNKMCTFQ